MTFGRSIQIIEKAGKISFALQINRYVDIYFFVVY